MSEGVVSLRPDPRSLLSPREIEVLEMAALGLTNWQIAARLNVTVHAVKFHLASIYRKLGISSRSQLAGALGKRTGS